MKITSLLLLGTCLFMIAGCEQLTPVGANQHADDDEVTAVTYETLQVLTDLPPTVRQVISEAYLNEKNIKIDWTDVQTATDIEGADNDSVLSIDIKATVEDAVLIKPNDPEPINDPSLMTAEEALLSGVPLPEATTGITTGISSASTSAQERPTDERAGDTRAPTTLTAPPVNSQLNTTAQDSIAVSADDDAITLNNTDPADDKAQTEDEIVVSMKDHYHLPTHLDVLLLHSAYDMQKMANHNQLQPIASQWLQERIPKTYLNPKGYWVGLSMYGRTIVYHKDKVNAEALVNYAKLADSNWRQKLCLTDYRYPDNQAILQVMKTHRGESKTRDVLTQWQLNLAGNRAKVEADFANRGADNQLQETPLSPTTPTDSTSTSTDTDVTQQEPLQPDDTPYTATPTQSAYSQMALSPQQISNLYYQDDTSVLEAIDAGRCEVGIVNSDTFIQYVIAHPTTLVRLTWANQINHGTMTNAITASIAKRSDDTAQALDFIEWLAGDNGQAILAFYSKTYPLAPLSAPNINEQAIRPPWSQFVADDTIIATVFESAQEKDSAH